MNNSDTTVEVLIGSRSANKLTMTSGKDRITVKLQRDNTPEQDNIVMTFFNKVIKYSAIPLTTLRGRVKTENLEEFGITLYNDAKTESIHFPYNFAQ